MSEPGFRFLVTDGIVLAAGGGLTLLLRAHPLVWIVPVTLGHRYAQRIAGRGGSDRWRDDGLGHRGLQKTPPTLPPNP